MIEDIPINDQGARPPIQDAVKGRGLMVAHTGMRGLLVLWIVIFHSLFYSVGWNLHGSALMPLFFLLSGYSLAIVYGKSFKGVKSAVDSCSGSKSQRQT